MQGPGHWWARLFSRKRMRAELAQEMAGHLEAKVEGLTAEGYSPEEAARRARIDFGNMPLMTERSVLQWQFSLFESVWADAKLAMHKLAKAPGYAALLMIATGTLLGATIALGCAVLVRKFLYGVSMADPWVGAASVGILFAVGLVAAAIPARRAAMLNPMLSLRSE